MLWESDQYPPFMKLDGNPQTFGEQAFTLPGLIGGLLMKHAGVCVRV